MPVGAASWSFTEDDSGAITKSLERFLFDSNARCALLVDRTGQLVATVGEQPKFDPTAFATLTAADFSANDQLAKLIGENDFSSLFHQGEKESISLATETERTLFFDFLPVDLGTIRGFKTRFHLYTVPGQVYYNASRKLILKGVDGIVFVADSQIERMEANQEAMQNLYDNMSEYGYDLTRMPFVIQYNKRDLPNAAPVKDLQASLNPGWEVTDPARQRVTPDPYHAGENLIFQLPTGEW